MIFDIDYKGDLPLCIRVSKEMIRKKMMRQKKCKIMRKN